MKQPVSLPVPRVTTETSFYFSAEEHGPFFLTALGFEPGENVTLIVAHADTNDSFPMTITVRVQ